MKRNQSMLVICGATASGKTHLSLTLAQALKGEIVCADSMQVYKGLDIGTAKPTQQEQQLVPHHMLDLAHPWERYSAGQYQKDARLCVRQIHGRNQLPIVVGGTGLFIDALTTHMNFSQAGKEEDRRLYWEAYERANGRQSLHDQLRLVDPQSAERLPVGDVRRVIRALVIYDSTGKPYQREDYRSQPVYENLIMLALEMEREVLYRRIDQRVDQMMESGLLEEARQVFEMHLPDTAGALQGIGYKEWFPYFSKVQDFDTCLEILKRQTRRYAKRQLTWFRRDPRIQWIKPDQIEMYTAKLLQWDAERQGI